MTRLRVNKTLSELWHLRGNLDGGMMTCEEYEKEAQDIAFMAINAIKKLQEEISLLKASRGASIECRQLFNEKMKLKEENEFLRDDVQIREERIEELKKELYALKRAVSKS